MKKVLKDRFAGIDRLYGQGAVNRYAERRVAVVGLGGVGSWVVEALARSGVGHLTLIDADDICVSNTNRQLPAPCPYRRSMPAKRSLRTFFIRQL